MNVRLFALIACLSVQAVALRAAEPVTFNLRGVTAGVTTQDELQKNDRWGEPLGKTAKPDGSTWIEYRFWAWQKVIAVVRGGKVQTVDAIPPDRLPAEKLGEALKLGELIPVESRKSLPPTALVGQPVAEAWAALRCSDAPGVLIFAEQTGEKRYAKLMRFHALGPGEKPYLGLRIRPITPAEAEAAGLEHAVGLCVDAVTPLSPGEECGVKVGDVILEFAGEKVAKSRELVAATHRQPIGATRSLKIVRNRKVIELDVLLKARPEHLGLFQTACSLDQSGRSREAVQMFSKAIELAPTQGIYYQKRSDCLRGIGLYEEALKDAQEAVRLSNGSASALLERAQSLTAVGQYQAALSDCEKVLEIDQTLAQAFAVRSMIYAALKDDDKALAEIDRAIQLGPTFPAAFWWRGKLLLRQKQYDRAIADFTKTVQLERQFFDAYYTRGWCYLGKGTYAPAAESFRQAIENLPKHEKLYLAYHGLGVALLNQKKYQEAVTSFNEAIRRNERLLEAYQGRAKAFDGLGLSAEAAGDRKKAEALGASRQGAENLVKDHRFAAFERGGGWGTGRYAEYGVWWNSKNAKSRAIISNLEPDQRPPGSDAATALYVNNASPDAPDVFGTTSQKIAVKKGRTYKITLWACSKKLASNGAVFVVVDPLWRVRPINLKSGTYTWTKFEGTFVANADEADLRIVSANTGEVWITDMTLTEEP